MQPPVRLRTDVVLRMLLVTSALAFLLGVVAGEVLASALLTGGR